MSRQYSLTRDSAEGATPAWWTRTHARACQAKAPFLLEGNMAVLPPDTLKVIEVVRFRRVCRFPQNTEMRSRQPLLACNLTRSLTATCSFPLRHVPDSRRTGASPGLRHAPRLRPARHATAGLPGPLPSEPARRATVPTVAGLACSTPNAGVQTCFAGGGDGWESNPPHALQARRWF
jgi:hypothetical protein